MKIRRGKKEKQRKGELFFRSLVFLSPFLLFSFSPLLLFAQKIAVIAPEADSSSRRFVEKLESSFPADAKILDGDLSDAAYRAQSFNKPFNLTLAQAKTIGASVGCDFFLLVKSDGLTRISPAGDRYFESYAAVFAASARTGRLVFFKLESRTAKFSSEASANLFDSAKFLAAEIFERLKTARAAEQTEKALPAFEASPDENSPEAKSFRPPLPYKRMSPVYTSLAKSYRVEATVDAEVDVDETGKISNVQIMRWAGFNLDESVAENVKRMNWRAATKNGIAVSTRILLRYNFKDIQAAR